MSLDAPTAPGSELVDRLERRPVSHTEVVHHGMVWDVRRDTVDLGEAGVFDREYVDHPGAVAVVALRTAFDGPVGDGQVGDEQVGDEQVGDRDEVLLIQQYRHPVGAFDWEIPAGLLDITGEPPHEAAARELAEEADLAAGRWDVLMDYWTTPGGVSEAIRIFLARDLADVPDGERHVRDGEELGMPACWVDLDEAHLAVLSSRLHNPSAIIGILAAHAARARDWATLRPVGAPWPEHPAYR